MTSPLLRRDPDALRRHHDEPWSMREPLAQRIAELAARRPDDVAFVSDRSRMTWSEYDDRSTRLCEVFVSLGLVPGDRVGVVLPDGPEVHAVYVAAEKAGLVVMGIGPRAGLSEVRHLLQRAACRVLVSGEDIGGTPAPSVVDELRAGGLRLEHHLTVLDEPGPVLRRLELDGSTCEVDGFPATSSASGRGLGPDDLFLLNSTSGTTGLPKCVMQHQNRWAYFHHVAAQAGRLDASDVMMSVVSAPFGFGLWTSHFTPALLGIPCVVMSRFSAGQALELIERASVTVLACVSTQFIMMLNSPTMPTVDLSSLRVMYT
ncbi:MAG: long-chain fatty acid--CoA ligase, partial [Actinomycetota bacterium]|nr:long-chain fatty acid--CoA ligase [Actinomycetota bacterium]